MVGNARPASLDVLIDGRAIESQDPRDVRHALLATAARPFSEIWLSVNGGPAMALLKSGERVLCLFVRHHGDPGFTSRRPLREKKSAASDELEFRVGKSGGAERSRFPENWTVPLFVALRAADEFLRTGERPPQIVWHDDAPTPASPAHKPAPAARKSGTRQKSPRKRST